MLITAITVDRLGHIIKVRINNINREVSEIWQILDSGMDTAHIISGSDTIPIIAARNPVTGRPFLRAAGTPTLSAPLAALPNAPMQMLVFGDSIAWGQGLRPLNKHYMLAGRRLRANNRGAPLTTTNFANSGAAVGPTSMASGGSGFTVTLDGAGENSLGEVPDTSVAVHAQIDAFIATGVDPATIDYIILSAGINDVGLKNILTFLNRSSAITSIITNRFAARMPVLLNRMTTVFPNARIFVTSYYPIITARSFPHNIPELMLAISFLTNTRPSVPAVLTVKARRNITGNCATFATAHLAALTTIVNSANAALLPLGPRIFVASPSFAPRHGLFAPPRTTRVFRINSVGVSNDERHGQRRPLCHTAFPPPSETNLACCGAAVGHPNQKGARAYFRALRTLL